MADQGAREIHDLLVTSSDTLAAAMKKLGDGLTLDDPDAEISRAAFHGISQARAYYGRLGRRIRRTETSSEAKHEVLDAIGRLDDSLALFAKGLRAGGDTDKGKERIDTAADEMQAAARDLNRATNALV